MIKRAIRDNCLTGLEPGARLLAHQCPSCKQVFYPRNAELCLQCLHETLDDIELSREGKLYSFTRSEVPSRHLKPPYVCGFVELPEGIRVFAPMHPDSEQAHLHTGLPVELVVGEVWRTEQEAVIGYHFKPLANGSH